MQMKPIVCRVQLKVEAKFLDIIKFLILGIRLHRKVTIEELIEQEKMVGLKTER